MKRIVFLSIGLYIALHTYAQIDLSIPVLNIETVNGEMPAATVVYAPEGCIGISITDNNYVPGRMTITSNGETLYDTKEYEKSVSGMRIKIRGNTTGAFLEQHPYKIKLSKKYDMLRRNDDKYKHKDWVLLSMYTWNIKMTNQQSNILNIAGLTMSKLLNKEWTPEYEFVHVYINEQYQGMYYLIESVEKGDKRVNVSDDGFLVEHDPFWWNEDVYFRTNLQDYIMAYTYKYPDKDDVTESYQNDIIACLDNFEDALYNNKDISKYIDIESFAKWILIHDILGTDDASGCNRFLYKYSLNDDSKIQMGPLWDYDSMFRSDALSAIHHYNVFYYPELFKRQDFKNIYYNLWLNIKDGLKEKIHTEFQAIKERYGETFDEGMKLHHTIFPNDGLQSFNSQIDEAEEKLFHRIDIFESLLNSEDITMSINPIRNINSNNNKITDIQGRTFKTKDIQNLPHGIYIQNCKKFIR